MGHPALLDLARHREQSLDDLRQAVDLLVGGAQLVPDGRVRRLRDRGLEPQLDPREGRAQLVRGVGHELLLRPHGALDPTGHLIEGPGELVDLGAALQLPRPRGQIAGPEAPRGGARDPRAAGRATARSRPRGRGRRRDHPSATATIAAVARPTFSPTVSDVPGDPHGADQLALVDDGGGRHGDVSPLLVAPPDLRGDLRCRARGRPRDGRASRRTPRRPPRRSPRGRCRWHRARRPGLPTSARVPPDVARSALGDRGDRHRGCPGSGTPRSSGRS